MAASKRAFAAVGYRKLGGHGIRVNAEGTFGHG
jgi:hypothetical protein